MFASPGQGPGFYILQVSPPRKEDTHRPRENPVSNNILQAKCNYSGEKELTDRLLKMGGSGQNWTCLLEEYLQSIYLHTGDASSGRRTDLNKRIQEVAKNL